MSEKMKSIEEIVRPYITGEQWQHGRDVMIAQALHDTGYLHESEVEICCNCHGIGESPKKDERGKVIVPEFAEDGVETEFCEKCHGKGWVRKEGKP